jgi:hypothetical protein
MIRKNIAHQLNNAATALENDRTKEKLGVYFNALRMGLAQAIMPNPAAFTVQSTNLASFKTKH